MLVLSVAVLCLGVCLAAPPVHESNVTPSVIPIVSQENNLEPDGSFSYGFESGDKTIVHEHGEIVAGDKEHPHIPHVDGSYSYVGPNGETYSVTYTAGEEGFHPEGAHIHPEPAHVAKALKFIEEHPYTETQH